MLYCPNCGKELIEGANYCHNCGKESPDTDRDDSDREKSGVDDEEVKESAKKLQDLMEDNPEIFDQLSPTEQTIIEELGLKPEK